MMVTELFDRPDGVLCQMCVETGGQAATSVDQQKRMRGGEGEPPGTLLCYTSSKLSYVAVESGGKCTCICNHNDSKYRATVSAMSL
jgi:hypothetical protein